MSSSEAPQISTTPVGLPTERDLDRLTAAIRSEGGDRGFPRRVIDRYQQWIFLFIGWCLKAPSGNVSRERIGDFWAALSEHPGAGTARTCEAMDALGFFFGHLQREARLLFLPDGPGGPEAGTPRATDRSRAEFSRPNPSLRAHDANAEGPPSTEALSHRQLSRHLPSGTLPGEVDARSEIPTQEISQDVSTREGRRGQDAPTSREERSPGDTSVTLFNPQGKDQHSGPSASSNAPSEPSGSDVSAEQVREQQEAQSEGRATKGEEHPRQEDDPEQADLNRVPVQIPQSVAKRLQKAAHRLGLPPSVFAARAIELVCDDAGIERLETPSADSPLKRYQTQIDLLQLREGRSDESGPEHAMGEDEKSPVEREDESAAQVADPEGRTSGSSKGSSEDANSERHGSVGENRSAEENASCRGNDMRDPGVWGNTGTSSGDGRGGAVSAPSL